MNTAVGSGPNRSAIGKWIAVITLLFATISFVAPRAHAQDDAARKILKSMLDYVASQKLFTVAFDSDIEVVTHDLQKLQFTSSGQLRVSRPDKVRASRAGGYTDVEFVFDGKTFTTFGRHLNAFAQAESPGSIDQIVSRLRDEYLIEAPGADLLLSSVYDKLIEDVIDAKHIGQGVIDGIECEHLAFRNPDTDWQVWVEIGARPIPRKYVITSKGVTGGPQYSLHIKEWRTETQTAADAFTFTPPAGAKKVEFKDLVDMDEVPAGVLR